MARKVVITCAVTGSVHTPTMSEYLPVTPDEIAEQAIGAAEAGAAVLHLHARDPKTGRPSPDPSLFMEFLPRIKQATDAVINISTGGGMPMTVQDRMQAALRAEPEMASLNMGTMNFGLYPMLERYSDFKHDWEEPFLESSRDFVFKNTFSDIETLLVELGEKRGTRFEFECYDVGHLYTLAHFVDRGMVKAPLFIQFALGILGGIGADADNLMHMKRTADKLFGDDYTFSVLAPAVIRCRWAPWGWPWAATSASGWKTTCSSKRACLPAPTPNRWRRSARSSRACRWKSPPRQRHAPCSASRAVTRWRSDQSETG